MLIKNNQQLVSSSFGNLYIVLAIDYVSKWVEVKATLTYDSKVVVDFIMCNIFARFGILKAMISDRGTHFVTGHWKLSSESTQGPYILPSSN